ncbi:MAG: hypothetical protein CG440_1235 [Methanosaeta sp. NSM2]|nr:MAG: hypothetical protein CG440_1235 [Methanosaeta sp. NSM2]
MPAGCGAEIKPPEDKGCQVRRRAEARASPAPCFSQNSSEGKLEADLLSETVKWQKKAQDLYDNISGEDEFLENVSAYIRDCQYFLDRGDLIRAFEAIIWAWAWMEIGLHKGLLRQKA